MSKKPHKNLVSLTLEIDDLVWLRDFLKEESYSAELDNEEVERLHTDVAIRAAKIELVRVAARMAKVVDALDVAIISDDARASIERKIAATTTDMPPVA